MKFGKRTFSFEFDQQMFTCTCTCKEACKLPTLNCGGNGYKLLAQGFPGRTLLTHINRFKVQRCQLKK